MKVSICTLFPDLYSSFLHTSLVKRACDNNLVSIAVKNIFSYVSPKQRIDSPTFGHHSGMLIKPAVVESVVKDLAPDKKGRCVVFFSPKGKKLDHYLMNGIFKQSRQGKQLLFLPARYEGMDARVEDEYADYVVSIGDIVLMGGDLPAMMLLEGLLRLVPGVISKAESVERDSFYGPLLDYPEYTHPVVWKGHKVPDVLRSGDHAKIESFRSEKSVQDTVIKRFDWFRTHPEAHRYTDEAMCEIPKHYAALYHCNVTIGLEGKAGTTSVTSIDIHDIARSAKTFGIAETYIVTSLLDQQKIVKTLLDYWKEGPGVTYNRSRHAALAQVQLVNSHEAVVSNIVETNGVKPLIIGTSACSSIGCKALTYHDQGRIFQQGRPILFAFGTGQGLEEEFLERCDYILHPIGGLTDYNHLSVRSAAAIVFDRWLGLNPVAGSSIERSKAQ